MKVDKNLLCKSCGNKLPCRKHTIQIDVTTHPPKIRIPRAVRAAMTGEQLREIQRLVGGKNEKGVT